MKLASIWEGQAHWPVRARGAAIKKELEQLSCFQVFLMLNRPNLYRWNRQLIWRLAQRVRGEPAKLPPPKKDDKITKKRSRKTE